MPGWRAVKRKPNMTLAPRRITLWSLETDALRNFLHLGLFQMKRSPGGTPNREMTMLR